MIHDPARRRLIAVAAPAVPALVLAAIPGLSWVALVLAAAVVVWGGWPIHRSAWAALRRGAATTDAIASVGTLAALSWSAGMLGAGSGQMTYLGVAAAATALVMTGRYLDSAPPALPDRVSAASTFTVLGLAAAALGFWLGAGAPPSAAVTPAVAVLIVACPCALGLAGPIPLLISARIKDATTTAWPVERVLTVHRIVADGDADEVLRMAASVGQASTGPVGRAIVAAARERFAEVPDVAEFDSTPELGMRGVVSELAGEVVVAHAVLVGTPALLAAHQVPLPGALARAVDEACPTQVIAVAWDGVARAVIVLRDNPAPEATARLARRTLDVIDTNVFCAFAPPVLALPLAASGLLDPTIAGAVMVFGPVCVLTNSLRLLRSGRLEPPKVATGG